MWGSGGGGGGGKERGGGRRLVEEGGGRIHASIVRNSVSPELGEEKKLACHLNPGDALSDVEDKWYASDSC